jgi:hypothetical protein
LWIEPPGKCGKLDKDWTWLSLGAYEFPKKKEREKRKGNKLRAGNVLDKLNSRGSVRRKSA